MQALQMHVPPSDGLILGHDLVDRPPLVQHRRHLQLLLRALSLQRPQRGQLGRSHELVCGRVDGLASSSKTNKGHKWFKCEMNKVSPGHAEYLLVISPRQFPQDLLDFRAEEDGGLGMSGRGGGESG